MLNPNDYSSMKDYLFDLNREYSTILKQYVENDSVKNFDDIVIYADEFGLHYLKDKFNGKKVVSNSFIGTTRQIVL